MTNFYQNDFETIEWLQSMPAGGYIANVRKIDIYDNGSTMVFLIDIAEGEYKEYFDYMYEFDCDMKFDCGYVIHMPSEHNKLVNLIHVIEQSNPGFEFNGDLSQLVGKDFGIVLQEQEYTEFDGTLSTRLEVVTVTTTKDIHAGNYTIPSKETLQQLAVSNVQ